MNGKNSILPQNSDIHVRHMTAADLEAALQLSTSAGWNQTAHDWQLFLQSSPQGCFVAVHDSQVMGTVTTISYGAIAWISMMLVAPAFQGLGIGRALMKQALEHLSDIPAIKLDATPAGQPLYEKLGFVVEDELYRWTCQSLPTDDEPAKNAHTIEANSMAAMTKWDAATFGAARAGVLRAFHQIAPSCAQQISAENAVSAFSLGRPGCRFQQIGPVTAQDLESAKTVTKAAVKNFAGSAAVMDVPSAQAEYSAWLEEQGFVRQRPLRRMVKGAQPQKISLQQFAIAGPEFG